MLRQETTPRLAYALLAAVGAACAFLVIEGNPGNMGICGACFLRDTGGALGLFAKGPKIFRPELLGIVFGALVWRMARGQWTGRSGSYAVSRFVLGIWMAIGALVFLGCPFRMLQRLGGGDLNAVVGALGLIVGVGVARWFERRGYNVGKTAPVPMAVGLVGPVTIAVVAGLWCMDWLTGPGPGSAAPPPHAPWMLSLAAAGVAGAILSATGFCAISACRQVWGGPKRAMLLAAVCLVVAYAIVAGSGGNLVFAFDGQPAAHTDHAWNALAMILVGLTGAFAGGCPVRQIVMTGEGNGDAFVTVAGLCVGGALAHTLGLASSGAGTTDGGRYAVMVGIAMVLIYATAIQRSE
ncbi:MAG: YedE-related selenium metabolism membrane protein [Planctomycetes bacterium]|nr:YedE-related selenium metabolism membrane protein [Planctomycetota bacterium]